MTTGFNLQKRTRLSLSLSLYLLSSRDKSIQSKMWIDFERHLCGLLLHVGWCKNHSLLTLSEISQTLPFSMKLVVINRLTPSYCFSQSLFRKMPKRCQTMIGHLKLPIFGNAPSNLTSDSVEVSVGGGKLRWDLGIIFQFANVFSYMSQLIIPWRTYQMTIASSNFQGFSTWARAFTSKTLPRLIHGWCYLWACQGNVGWTNNL